MRMCVCMHVCVIIREEHDDLIQVLDRLRQSLGALEVLGAAEEGVEVLHVLWILLVVQHQPPRGIVFGARLVHAERLVEEGDGAALVLAARRPACADQHTEADGGRHGEEREKSVGRLE